MDSQTAHQRDNSQVFLAARDFAARYGKQHGNYHVWLARRTEADSRFPKVTLIGHRKFYRITEIEAWERACAEESSAN